MKISGIENTYNAALKGLHSGGQESPISSVTNIQDAPKDEVAISAKAEMLMRQAEEGKAALLLIASAKGDKGSNVFALLDSVTFVAQNKDVEVSEAFAGASEGTQETFGEFWERQLMQMRISAELSLQSDDPATREIGERLMTALNTGTFRIVTGNEIPGLNLRVDSVITDRSETHSTSYNAAALKDAGLVDWAVGWHKDFGTFVITW